jgi:16S rRNA C967 or C1407 C5-methylase (RsmB/RsmF family)
MSALLTHRAQRRLASLWAAGGGTDHDSGDGDSGSGEGLRVADVCAAPGGKSAQLATMLGARRHPPGGNAHPEGNLSGTGGGGGGDGGGGGGGGGVSVAAVEASPKRARLLAANLRRLGLEEHVQVLVGDGRAFNTAAFPYSTCPASQAIQAITTSTTATTATTAPASRGQVPGGHCGGFAGVLVDAPCSATGTGRRRPDVLRKALPPTPHALARAADRRLALKGSGGGGRSFRGLAEAGAFADDDVRAAAEFRSLVALQAELAEHCARAVVGTGGVLVYATCSLLVEEGEHQAERLAALLALDESDDSGDCGNGGHEGHDGGTVEAAGRGEGPAKAPASRLLLRPLPIAPGEVPGFDGALTAEGWLRVLPGCLGGDLASCDGFFVARFVKN